MEKVHTYDADASEKYVCPDSVVVFQPTVLWFVWM
jgi:hypothetical protein